MLETHIRPIKTNRNTSNQWVRTAYNASDLNAVDAVARYKGLADIERGFRVLKSDIEIAPVHHRLPDRIRAHA
jgi:transposase